MATPPGRTRTCYACGDHRDERHMQPFGTTCFGEPRSWVCSDCSTLARAAAPSTQPPLATTASR